MHFTIVKPTAVMIQIVMKTLVRSISATSDRNEKLIIFF